MSRIAREKGVFRGFETQPKKGLLIRLKAARSTNGTMILGDAAQNVYRTAFRWSDTGFQVAGGWLEETARRIWQAMDESVPPSSIAVFANTGEYLHHIEKVLTQQGIPTVKYDANGKKASAFRNRP